MALPAFGSALDTWLRHTADMLTLITTGEKETGAETRGDEGEIRGIREAGESSEEGWMKRVMKVDNGERMVGGKEDSRHKKM